MPLYCWACNDCGHVTEIVRPMANYQVPPDSCDNCNKTALIKIIEPMKKEQTAMIWGGSAPCHAEAYGPRGPIR